MARRPTRPAHCPRAVATSGDDAREPLDAGALSDGRPTACSGSHLSDQRADRVGNNPDYWAELYEEQEARHGAQSTRRLMAASGYPGGDLELDDRLETDGERVCFRLLQPP